jgi:toxin ParE1/3/4
MKIIWRQRALWDMERIAAHIAPQSPSGARRMNEAITGSVSYLRDWPEMRRGTKRAGVRELVIPQTPYLVSYRIEARRVAILRVFHAAQNR